MQTFYIGFLMFYSYVILFEFRKEMTLMEWLMIGWIASLLMEEIREVGFLQHGHHIYRSLIRILLRCTYEPIIICFQMFFRSKADSIFGRVVDWWNFSLINRFDLIILTLASLALILRLTKVDIIHVKTIYCINCVFLFIRLLREYNASSYLGPKLVMITKMVNTHKQSIPQIR